MLEDVSTTCEAECCRRRLTDDQLRLTMTTPGGTRRAYECDCGAVTITVVSERRGRH